MLFKNKIRRSQLRTVNFDAYGNAIPNTSSIRNETSSIAASIVQTREIIVKPSRKFKTKKLNSSPSRLINQLIPWREKNVSRNVTEEECQISKALTDQHSDTQVRVDFIPKEEVRPHASNLSSFFDLGFQKLHDEFARREKQMELRFQALHSQHQQKNIKKRWLIPVALMGVFAMGYVLYVLTSMQKSMTIMSANIPVMNQHMGAMANDTQNMSSNMHALNGNVAHMNSSVYQMNQQMNTVSNAMVPMGKAAKTAQPFMGMMRSFMPF